MNVWARQPKKFFERATIDLDGTLVVTTGECKAGMDISYKGTWGYHPGPSRTLGKMGRLRRWIQFWYDIPSRSPVVEPRVKEHGGMVMVKIGEREVRGIVEHFRELPDPRSTTNRRHWLVDVLVISVLAVIAGADGPVGIALWGTLNHDWLKRHLKLPHGIPSHDTFGRVLETLKPAAFQRCFSAWLESLLAEGKDDAARAQVAIDGKALRGSHDRSHGLGPLFLVSAWATEYGITLGQVATEEKSNEITAIPELFEAD